MGKAKTIVLGVAGLLGLGGLAMAFGGSSDDKKKKTAQPMIPPIGGDMPPKGTITIPPVIITPSQQIPPNGQAVPGGWTIPGIGTIPVGYNPPIDSNAIQTILTGFGVPPAAQGPVGRFASVRAGEGPHAFVTRVSGAKYAERQPSGHWGWHDLEGANPDLELNDAGDGYTNDTWFAGAQIKIPDAWPGGVPSVGTSSGSLTGGPFS